MGSRFEKIACSAMSSTANKDRLYELEQVLLMRLPESVHMLNLCHIAIQDKFPNSELVEFYGYFEDEQKNWQDEKFSFIVCIERPNLHAKKAIILLPAPEIRREMVQALDTLIGWDEPQVFETIPQPLWAVITELCTLHGNLKPTDSEGIPGILLAILDVEKGKQLGITCDSNVTVRQLEQKDVPEVVRNWKWAQGHSEKEIAETIKTLTSCGAFLENGEMLSSVLLSALGIFNVLWTPEKFRRRGYGQLVMSGVSKWAAEELAIHPVAEVEVWNEASKRTMEKVGYHEIYRTRWFYFNPSQTIVSRTEGHH